MSNGKKLKQLAKVQVKNSFVFIIIFEIIGPLCRHCSLVYDDHVYIYGGKAHSIIDTNRLFVYDIKTNEWNVIESKFSPSPSESFALIYSEKDAVFYIFGGFNSMNGEFNNEMFAFDLKETFWKKVQYKSERNPCVRAGHSCVLYKESIYMFGGEIFDKKFNDLWIYDIASSFWKEVQCKTDIWPCVN